MLSLVYSKENYSGIIRDLEFFSIIKKLLNYFYLMVPSWLLS
jgi:hypothetical protein